MVQRVEQNTHMYLGLFADAADARMPPPSIPADMLPEDVYDVLIEQVCCVEYSEHKGTLGTLA